MVINYLSSIITFPFELFSRAGGGGSDSGDAGELIIILLGYAPMHLVGKILRKFLPIWLASIIGWPIAIAYAIFWIFVDGWGFIISIAALAGIGGGLYNWFNKIAKLAGIAKKKQATAFQNDSAWDTNALNNQVTATFMSYQSDWSKNDVEPMRQYLTPYYFYHNQLMVLALRQLGRMNIVGNPVIKKMELIDITDSVNNNEDRFVMLVTAKSADQLYETSTNKLIFQQNMKFQEYWKFIRSGSNSWLLEGISQVTEDPYMMDNAMLKFAQVHNYCYSLDWGWLLLPARGQIFGKGKFGTSDINNHIIGVYNNTLIQLYNYVPAPKNNAYDNYIIAQVALPKTYGNIVVRKKRKIPFMGIKGLTKVSMEWGDFNNRYDVWASDMERVTSFELLNPSFMVKLQELPIDVNIEVVDNIVYLYSENAQSTPESYEIMLTILYQAFKEMRM